MTLLQPGYRYSSLAVLSTALLLGACGGGKDVDNDTNGGAGSGGSETSGAGSAGAPAGGSGGSGGSGGMVTVNGKMCPTPTIAAITDFTYDATTATSTEVISFGDAVTTFSGGTYVYPPPTDMYPVHADVTESNWHITGSIGNYSGFGIYLQECHGFDASAFKGISFTISGSVAHPTTPNRVTLNVGTAADTVAASFLNAQNMDPAVPEVLSLGRCIPRGNPPGQYDGTCNAPIHVVEFTDTPTTVTVLWTDLASGTPQMGVTPTELTSFQWNFPNPPGVAMASVVPYDVDLVVDNFAFVE